MDFSDLFAAVYPLFHFGRVFFVRPRKTPTAAILLFTSLLHIAYNSPALRFRPVQIWLEFNFVDALSDNVIIIYNFIFPFVYFPDVVRKDRVIFIVNQMLIDRCVIVFTLESGEKKVCTCTLQNKNWETGNDNEGRPTLDPNDNGRGHWRGLAWRPLIGVRAALRQLYLHVAR